MGGEGPGGAWREQVLDQTLRWAQRLGLVLSAIGVVSMLSSNPARLLHPAALLMLGAFSGTFLLRRPALPYRLRAQLFCWLVLVTGSSSIVAVGLLPGPVLCSALPVVCAGLFLGRRTMWLLLGVSTLSVAVLGGWNAAHYSPALPAALPAIGFRFGAGYALVTAALAVLVEHVVAHIERSLEASSEALRRLNIAEQERRRTEQVLAETQSALQRSQKLEAVGRLAAGVGHDFNNSLQVVLSWASLLQGETDPKQLDEGLTAIQQAALQGSELTQRLLTFGRRDVRAPGAVNVAELLADAARSLRRMLPEDIVIDLQKEGPPAQVLADAAQLSHILLNLGLNARDAMPEGGRLTLGTRLLSRAQLPAGPAWPSEPDSWVAIWVRDSGIGMSEETQAHIFEPFFTTKGDRGNGLGLATSYALVEQNGGFIRVQSQQGQGTTLELYFPEQVAMTGASTSPIRSRPPRASLGVMVAEDDENVRSSLVRALGVAGFRVYESADAASAIQLLDRVGRDVDVLCTDGIMPGGGTRELIERYLARRPEGKVIICSGYVKEELLRRQIDAGALAYLAKPFLPAELIERIHTLTLAGSEAAAPAQSTVRASTAPAAARAPRTNG